MNREIKFRFIYGIDGEENTYFSKVFTFGEIENGCHLEVLSDNPLYRNYSILAKHQFTGLLDKHGKEIYEGDIVADDDYPEDGPDAWVSKVYYKKGQFCIYDDLDISLGLNAMDCQVIGNIYENPELLEDK